MSAPAPAWIHEYIANILTMVDMLDSGKTVEDIKAKATASGCTDDERQALFGALELASLIVEGDKEARTPELPVVRNPAFRRGNGRKPIPWNKCLWQPGSAKI